MDYEVKLEIFEGPLDLLLHLIRKNEVDIFDIPIATITDQYLAYLDMLKALNINIAGDFFVMASTLIHIKSKMLLPEFEDDEEEEDPRIEITRPLLEYLRLKEIAGELTDRDILERDVFIRRLSPEYMEQIKGEEPLLDLNLFQLIDAFKRIIDQRLPGVQLHFRVQKWSLKEKTAFIMEKLKARRIIHFSELFEEDRTISEFIVTFLALLELVHVGLIRVFQTDLDKDIRLEAHFGDKEGH
ncbi:MAG: segregation/condensation protein A [Pseudomonadota bacterium]